MTNNFFDGNLYIDLFIKYNNKQYFIEYNGRQHYIPIEYFEDNYSLKNNKEETNYCEIFVILYQDKVSLLEISYKEPEENIENIILNFINYDIN